MTVTTSARTTDRSRSTDQCDRSLRGRLAVAVPTATAVSLAVWGISQLGGVDLVVRTGDGSQTVGWVSVLLASAVATAIGTVMVQLLRRRLRHGRAVGFWVATVVFLLSLLLGPAAATTASAAFVLGTMHAVVWGVVTGPLRHRC